MLGFLIGTACLIGLIATVKRARFMACHGGYAYDGCGGGYGGFGGCGPQRYERWGHHHHHHHGRGGFRGGPFGVFRMVSERLDLSPAQEKVVRQSMEEVRETLAKHRHAVKESRSEVAKAFRAPSFDAVLLGDLFGKHDAAIEDVRKTVVGALSRVHDALDERQRERLAELLEGGWW